MRPARNVKKSGIVMQDLVQGTGSFQQDRRGQTYTVHRVDVPIAVNTTAEVEALDINQFTRARVYVSTTRAVDYIYDPEATIGLASTGPGKWVVSQGGASGGTLVVQALEDIQTILTPTQGLECYILTTGQTFIYVIDAGETTGQWTEKDQLGDDVDVTAASHLTLAQAQASDLKVGQYVVLTDLDNALYKKVSSDTGQSFYIALGDGSFLEYVQIVGTARPEIHTAKIGVSSTNGAASNSSLLESMRGLIATSNGKIKGVYSGGDIPVSTTMSLLGVKHAEFDNFNLKPQFEGTAVAVAPAVGQLVENYEWRGTLRVVWDTIDYSTNRIAFFLQNMYNCKMHLSSHRSFRGIYCNGNETGFVHNDIYISDMFNNFTDVYLTTSTATGWCNSNRFHGGFFYGSGDLAGLPNASEAAHIYIDETSGYKPNGNRFINPSLEWVGDGKMMANLAGLRNRIEVQYTEVNDLVGGSARAGAWFKDRGENNVWDLVNVPYIIGYEEGNPANRLDIAGSTAPWIKGVQGYYDTQGLGTQHYKTTGTRPAIRCDGDDKILVARNTSSGALPAIAIEGPTGQAGVAIPAAGEWVVFNGTRKVLWNNVIAPTTGLHRRGDIAYNIEPSAGGNVGWVCVSGDGTDVGTWRAFGTIEV